MSDLETIDDKHDNSVLSNKFTQSYDADGVIKDYIMISFLKNTSQSHVVISASERTSLLTRASLTYKDNTSHCNDGCPMLRGKVCKAKKGQVCPYGTHIDISSIPLEKRVAFKDSIYYCEINDEAIENIKTPKDLTSVFIFDDKKGNLLSSFTLKGDWSKYNNSNIEVALNDSRIESVIYHSDGEFLSLLTKACQQYNIGDEGHLFTLHGVSYLSKTLRAIAKNEIIYLRAIDSAVK